MFDTCVARENEKGRHNPNQYMSLAPLSADLFQSESVLAYIVIHQYLAILRFSRHQIIAIPSNPPFCRLQSSYIARVQDNFSASS